MREKKLGNNFQMTQNGNFARLGGAKGDAKQHSGKISGRTFGVQSLR
jgi:hypothetical protein